MSWEMDLLFFLGGCLAGIVNTLAGNGSAITVSLLLFGGLDGAVANATNRVGVILQTLTSITSVRPSARKRYLLHRGKGLILPTLLGSFAGGWLGSQVSADGMEWSLAIVMVGMLVTLFWKPEAWGGPSEVLRRLRPWQSALLFFAIGFYGGYIQMGIGILMLSVLVLADRWSLRDANVIKLLMALVLALPAGILYIQSGLVEWRPGLILALGSMLGAWIGGRYIVRIPKAQPYVRWILVAVVVFGAAQSIYKAMT
ncbi:MAG: sulfite exporter TauE/SafE family protein [Schleiferiaceae bacterium]|jgi:uncharacterized membrane protein YfcA